MSEATFATSLDYDSLRGRLEYDARHNNKSEIPNIEPTLEGISDNDEIDGTTEDGVDTIEYPDTPLILFLSLETYMAPILFTAAAFYTRLYKIGINKTVVWDEAHFGKFASFYLLREYYFDVHPPLGKMLLALSGWLVGYKGDFTWDSGAEYPDTLNYTGMRIFNALFGVFTVPLAYYTAKAFKFSLPTVWFITLMVCLEHSYITLSKFILLDSMLIFFTALTFFCLSKFHTKQDKSFTGWWWFWLVSTGLSIGCVCSVKLVGLFVTALVGLYTIADLWHKLSDSKVSIRGLVGHFISRVFGLIIIPLLVFAACFKVHFIILNHSGKSDTHMSSLFQANLIGSTVTDSPYDVGYASLVTLHSQSGYGGLLHSHVQTYRDTDKQQITTYAHKDDNNDWIVQPITSSLNDSLSPDVKLLEDGSLIRLLHLATYSYLSANDTAAPITNRHKQVSAFSDWNATTDAIWSVEIVDEMEPIRDGRIHPITTSFRLKNIDQNCYLTVTGSKLPLWGFGQGEVTCNPHLKLGDKRSIWNVERHSNHKLPTLTDRKLPKSRFLDDVINLNIAMMATNNALVPDPDKHDELASLAWEWPVLHTGLRMNGWNLWHQRYYLLEHPLVLWGSTASLVIFVIISLYYAIRRQRSFKDFSPEEEDHFMVGGVLPLFGWILHYAPFVVMARVTYVHHYLPALYFAIFVLGFVVENMSYRMNWFQKSVVYLSLYAVVIYIFRLFSPICYGMTGDTEDYLYLRWLKSWNI